MRVLTLLLLACARSGPVLTPVCPACSLVGDFDGDGRRDRLVRVTTTCEEAPCPQALVARLATGAVERLGAPTWERLADDGTLVPEPAFADVSFVEGWRTLVRTDGAVRDVGLAPGSETLALPGLAGDAVWMTSSDVAIVVWRSPAGWRYSELGY